MMSVSGEGDFRSICDPSEKQAKNVIWTSASVRHSLTNRKKDGIGGAGPSPDCALLVDVG